MADEIEKRAADAIQIALEAEPFSNGPWCDLDQSYIIMARAAIEAMQNTPRPCTCHTMNQMAGHQRGCPHWRAEPWPATGIPI